MSAAGWDRAFIWGGRRLFSGMAVFLCCFTACQNQGGRWSRAWEEKFEEWQPSEYIMDQFGIAEGMTVAEIGAGNGRFAVRLAQRVGPAGRVYANDIDPKALSFMRRRIQKERIPNMNIIQGGPTDPKLPENQCDVVCIVNTYDDLRDPVALMRNTARSLKTQGLLGILVYDPEKVGDLRGHAVPRDTVIRQMNAAGFELVRLNASLSKDTLYIFRVQ